MTLCKFAENVIKEPQVRRKTVHIVVKDGLVQEVYAENVDVEIVIHDLDETDCDVRDDIEKFVAQLPDFTKKVY